MQKWAVLALFLSSCGSSTATPVIDPGLPSGWPDICSYVDSALTPRTCDLPMPDHNAICNQPNFAQVYPADTCGNAAHTNMWVPASIGTAQHLSASFDCQGYAASAAPSVWLCKTAQAAMTFLDGSKDAFSVSYEQAQQPNANIRALELTHCHPTQLYASLSGDNGGPGLNLVLAIPDASFDVGSAALYSADAPSSDANAVEVTARVTAADAGFMPGTIVSGRITIAAANVHVTQRLAFTLDANMAAPGVQSASNATYCGDPSDAYYGKWFVLGPAAP